MTLQRYLTVLWLSLFLTIELVYGSKLRKKKETSLVKFMKLLFYRLIYGFANMIGMGEVAEEFGDGILAPPDSDYRLDAGDDDYDNDKSDDYYSYDTY